MIEKAYIDIDSVDGPNGEPITKAWLHLEGDFVDEALKYVNFEDATAMVIEIPQDVAKKLYKSLGEVL
jgi:hypothetical protein